MPKKLYLIRIGEYYQVFDDEEKYNKRLDDIEKQSKKVEIKYTIATLEKTWDCWESPLPF